MANHSLDQFAHLKQPTSDYLPQLYEISHKLCDLLEALKLLSSIQAGLKSQTEGIALLQQAANEIESYIRKALGLFKCSSSIGGETCLIF